MAKFVRFIQDKSESQRSVILPDGRLMSLYDETNKWSVFYGTPFNLKTGEIMNIGTQLGGDIVSLNYLAGWREGSDNKNYKRLPELHCYEEHYIFVGESRKLPAQNLNKIIKELNDNGFDVDKIDILELFNSWKDGWKTGIRNDKRGYFLFCPAGDCNPFSINCTSLHPFCSDWQITYYC